MSILSRLEKLEAVQSEGKGLKVLRWYEEEGETRDECIWRHGYDPDERGVFYLLLNAIDAAL